MERPVLPSPARDLARKHITFGAVAVVLGVAVAWAGTWFPALVAFGLGALWLWSGFVTRSSSMGAQTLNRAWDATSRGRLAEARELLDGAASRYQFGYIRQAIDLCRARIAYRCGDLPAALERTTAAADRGLGLLARANARMNRTAARALRAVVRAAMGDAAGARDDAAFVRASPDALPDALARAELAEALLLEKTGDREALGAHLARHAYLFAESTTPRERAIVRAYERLLRRRQGSVYRERAPGEPATQQGNEPSVEDWISTVAPAAAPFALVRRVGVGDAGGPAEGADPALLQSVAARLAVKPRRPWRRLMALWVLLVMIFLAVWQFLEPAPPARHRAAPPPPVDGGVETWLPLLFFLVVFGAILGYQLVGARRQSFRALAALRRAAQGEQDEADRELEALTKSRLPVVKGLAYLNLATSAERRATFAQALERCDQGLAAVSSTPLARAVASSALTPELLAERAVTLAALGREAEASAEMAHVAAAFPGYALLARAERRIGVLLRARRGDLAGAADLAASDACDAPIPARDELLGDLARAAARPEAGSPEEVTRLQGALRDAPEARRWIEAVAPGVLAAFAARGRGGTEEVELQAEREAQAEDEAVAHAAEARH